MKSQKQCVFDAILVVKGELTKELSKAEHLKVSEIVTQMILDGECVFSDEAHIKYDTVEKKFGYVKGMVNNWLRKASELNDGKKFEPSYRKGPQKSETLKALEALAEKHPENDEVREALEAQRTKENEEKNKKKEVKINVDALPDHLKSLVG